MNERRNYDLTVIGAGPGGYQAALKAASLGAKVCLIEKDLIGGTCLNCGCIPTKSLSFAARSLHAIKKAQALGIDIKDCQVNWQRVQARKEEVVSKLRQGAEAFLKSKGIDIIIAAAEFVDANTLKAASQTINSKNIIIATGSKPIELKNIKFDHKRILSSQDGLALENFPKALAIIGGGYIGCEFAFIFNELGSKVTIIEAFDQLLPNFDKEIARRLESIFKKNGITIMKGTKVEDAGAIDAEKIILSIGRTPNIEGLGLEKIGIKTERNKILVDKYLRTNIPNIYAIGDVTGIYYLAHFASYQGEVCAGNIFTKPRSMENPVVPSCIFTVPEIASVGLSEEEAKAKFKEPLVTKLPFSAVSKAHIIDETEGLIKVISDKQSGKILGAYILGPMAGEIIPSFVLAMQNNLTLAQVKDTIYAHPTVAEGIHDLPVQVNK